MLFNTEDEEHEVEILFKNFETFELKGVFGMLVELDFVVEIVEVFVLFVIGGGMTSAENTKKEKWSENLKNFYCTSIFFIVYIHNSKHWFEFGSKMSTFF